MSYPQVSEEVEGALYLKIKISSDASSFLFVLNQANKQTSEMLICNQRSSVFTDPVISFHMVLIEIQKCIKAAAMNSPFFKACQRASRTVCRANKCKLTTISSQK